MVVCAFSFIATVVFIMNRVIFHVDVNSAFLSWEATRRVALGEPDLRLVPSAVGGDPKSRTSIISAKSIPAKKYGINTGEPVSLALRKCPELIVVKPDFALYRRCSADFIAICRSYAPLLEQFSIDECFMDMTGTELIYPDIIATAHELKDKIRDELGFTVNVGIGSNKLLAKMASDFEKPDKVHTLFTNEIESKMWPLPIGDLLFAGKAAQSRLISNHINTIGDLARLDEQYVKSLLGDKLGSGLYAFSHGIDDSPVSEERDDAKSYSMATTLEENVTSSEQAYEILHMLAENVSAKMRHDKAFTTCVSVTIRSTEFVNKSHQKSLYNPTDVTIEIFEVARELFDELWDGRTPLRLLNIGLSGITREEYTQMSLFEDPSREKSRKIDKMMDGLHDKYGKNSIKRGI